MIKYYAVFAEVGEKLKGSDEPSYIYNFSTEEDTRVLYVYNSDKTNSKYYSILGIRRNKVEEIEEELCSQLNDGIYENVDYSHFSELTENEVIMILTQGIQVIQL